MNKKDKQMFKIGGGWGVPLPLPVLTFFILLLVFLLKLISD